MDDPMANRVRLLVFKIVEEFKDGNLVHPTQDGYVTDEQMMKSLEKMMRSTGISFLTHVKE